MFMPCSACLVSHGIQRGLKPLRRSQCVRKGALEGDADVGLLVVIDAHADCGCGPSHLGGLVRGASHEELDDDLVLVRDVSLATLKTESELVESLADESAETFELNFAADSARALVGGNVELGGGGVADGDVKLAPGSPDA